MAFEAGMRLGQYEIVAWLGAGGMGEVYHARDGRLGRDVALKVVRHPFDDALLTRFDREARLLASLTHPSIATLYGADEADGVRYIVMELVPGQTLAQRLQAGPLDITETLEIAVQVASALEYAHEHGIVHRDLKPANVKVTPDGSVKVLDFGLAKMVDIGRSDVGSGNTLTNEMRVESGVGSAGSGGAESGAQTRHGVVLGTAAYMSPEQARGQAVDRRMDVWAFGCLLYELLTGRPAFSGATLSDTVAAIIDRDPNWDALPARTPHSIGRLIRRCLVKDAKRRLRDIGDARLELQEVLTSPSGELAAPALSPRPQRATLRWALTMLGLGIAAGAGAVFLTLPREAAAPRPKARFLIALPAGTEFAGLDFPALAASPSGTHLAYVGVRGGRPQIFVRTMSTLESAPLAGTEDAVGPFFSPDGQWVGFFAGGNLQKVPVGGGAPVVVCPAPIGFGGVWNRDDVIVFAPANGSALWKVPAAGGEPVRITELDTRQGEFSHRWPDLLPDGETVLFTAGTRGSWDDAQIVAQKMGTEERRTVLIEGGTHPRYVPTGHLLFVRHGTLMAAAFDATRLRVAGQPLVVVPDVQESFDGAGQFAITDSGRSLIYLGGHARGVERRLVWVDRRGAEQTLGVPPRAFASPRISPDGRAVVTVIEGDRDDLWLYDLPTGDLTQLTFEGQNSAPVWAPDGARVAFGSARGGPVNLFWKRIEGGADERIATSATPQAVESWSPDGRALTIVERDTSTGRDVWVLGVGESGPPRPLLRSPANESGAAFSPNGRFIAYVSDESGRPEVYVAPYPDGGRKARVSVDGGTEPVWSHDGRELFYRAGGRMMAARVATSGPFRAEPPSVLFEGPYEHGVMARANYDVDHYGTRFLMVRSIERDRAGEQLHIVQEWHDELVRREPSSR